MSNNKDDYDMNINGGPVGKGTIIFFFVLVLLLTAFVIINFFYAH